MEISELFEVQQALKGVSPRRLELAEHCGWKVPVGQETRPGWTGYLMFYIFWCPWCEAFGKDYGHGFPGRMYVTCQRCNRNLRFRAGGRWLMEKRQSAWGEEGVDPLAPARGIFRGILLSLVFFMVIAAVLNMTGIINF